MHHAAAQHGLLDVLKGDYDHYHSPKRGKKRLEAHAQGYFDPKHTTEPAERIDELEAHLGHLQQHPEASIVASPNGLEQGQLASTAVQYFSSIKPQSAQVSPLDAPVKPNPVAEAQYKRQLANAQNPMLVLDRAKRGQITPQDRATLTTLFPQLAKSAEGRLFEEVVKAKTQGKHISYRQKLGLSMLLGQPLDASLQPNSLQAIVASQGPQQVRNQATTPRKPSGPELTTIEKVDELSETPLEARLAHRKR